VQAGAVQAAAGPLLAVNGELGAKADKGDAGHGMECATRRSAGEDAGALARPVTKGEGRAAKARRG
jgi:hypothetical protein